jgi:perosamine synthetase
MTWKIPLFKIYFDETDIRNVTDSLNTGMNWAIGPNIDQFEKGLSNYIGSKYCTTFNSGTSALHALLMAYKIGKGNEIIVPSFTFIATANSPLFVGAKPVFADIEEETYGLDPEDVVRRITPKTRAIMPIHYGGCPCKIRELREIAQDHHLLLIEDAAESLGATIGNKKVGSFGDAGMLSFCQNKIITTGEGGAIVTDSKETFEKLKLIRSHGRLETSDYFTSTDIFDYVTLGFNFRMSNITAALGVAQLQKVDKIIKMRRDLAGEYIKKLSKLRGNIKFNHFPYGYSQVFQLFSIRANKRDDLIQHLANNGIMTKIYFSPIHTTHFYQKVLKYTSDLPVTEKVSSEILSLPFYPRMSRTDLEFVVDSIDQFYSEV